MPTPTQLPRTAKSASAARRPPQPKVKVRLGTAPRGRTTKRAPKAGK